MTASNLIADTDQKFVLDIIRSEGVSIRHTQLAKHFRNRDGALSVALDALEEASLIRCTNIQNDAVYKISQNTFWNR